MSLNGSSISARSRGQAFTLVEILIVVVILGILAAIVIPQFVSATKASQENALRMDLLRIRTQLEIYKETHGQYPTLASFGDQLTMATNSSGTTAAPGTVGFPFGPYLRSVPVNPNTGTATVGSGAVGSSDWYFDETSGEFHPNDSVDTRAY